jgi:hypothetical protein
MATRTRRTPIRSNNGLFEGRVTQALERADEDRIRFEDKIDLLTHSVVSAAEAARVAAGKAENVGGEVRNLAQSLASATNTLVKLSEDDCGRRLNSMETLVGAINDTLVKLSPRIIDCENGVEEWRNIKNSAIKYIIITLLAALGAGWAGGGGVNQVATFVHDTVAPGK